MSTMPVFEFVCQDCTATFEVLVRHGGSVVTCPACHSHRLERQVSAFGVSSAATRDRHIQSARRDGTTRAVEKMHADVEWEKSHDH